MRDVVAVAHALLVGVCRAHAIASVIIKAPREKSGRASQADLPVNGVGGELCLHGVEHVAAEDAAGGASAFSGEIVLSFSIRRPKKRGPLQFVPVMARAMVERLA
jgi:hypothetical protein